MKKVISMSVKPLAMATAFAAGTTASMIAAALPGGGDTLGAVKVVNESVCRQSVDMTVASATRSVTTGTGTCQLRTLPPTQGFVLTESAPAGATVADSSAMVGAGGESYATFVGGKRSGSMLLTPNRALAVSHDISYASGNGGSVSYSVAATVQPSTGLQSSWLTGTYRILNTQHGWDNIAADLENSSYASPNHALGMYDYTSTYTVQFNGNGTCNVLDVNDHWAAILTKDPLVAYLGEMDVTCSAGGGNCGQNDGSNYKANGVINIGSTSTTVQPGLDWNDLYKPDGQGLEQGSCTYSTAAGKVTVHYDFLYGTVGAGVASGNETAIAWDTTYDVSADLRYLVSDGNSATEGFRTSADPGYNTKGNMAVGVRQGTYALAGKTYLFNAIESTLAMSTPTTASYENPVTPVYQEEQCVSRGSLALAAAGACTYNVVSSCTGRNHTGYEENTSAGGNGTTTTGVGSGTVVDSLTGFNGSPATAPTCSWSGTAQNLAVNVGVKDQNGNPITVQYTGSASDNGEALVLQGIYHVLGPVADTQNAPLLDNQRFNTESFLVAQEYQGSLTADANADGVNNYGEFTWAKDVGGNAVRSDFNGDGTSDIFMRADAVDSFALNLLIGNDQRIGANGLGYTSTHFNVLGFADINGDGLKDVLLQDDGTLGNLIIGQLMGAGGALSQNVLVGYTDGNTVVGLIDKLKDNAPGLLFSTSGGIYFTKTIINSAFSDFAQVGSGALPGTFSYVAMGDVDGNGEKDVVFKDSSTDRFFAFKRANNQYAGYADVGGAGSGLGFVAKGVKDVNNDGRADVIIQSSSNNTIYALEPDATGGNGSYVALGGFNGGDVVIAVEDLDGDGDADVMVSSNALGQVYVMEMQGGALASYNTILYSTALTFSGLGAFNGGSDLGVVWTTAGGDLILSQMSGAALGQHVYLGTFDPSLKVHME